MRLTRWRRSWQEFRRGVRSRRWSDLTLHERKIRFALDIARVSLLRLRRNRAGMMAAALSYRVLFSMLPLLVLAAGIARLSVSRETFLETVRDLIHRFGLQRVEIAGGNHAGEQLDLGNWLESLATQAADVDITGVTWIGLLVLLWAAYRLFDEIEGSLSVIGAGTKRRKAWVRVVVSILLLVVGPAFAIWGLAVLNDLTTQLEATGVSSLAKIGQWILSFVVVWGFVTLCYRFIPAGRLGWRSSGAGALVGAVSLLVGEWVLEKFVIGAVRTSPIGGSLGLVPLLMLWVYVMWICLLYGMEIAVIMHKARRRWSQLRSIA
ncbi:MAG: YihY/virulence factor BrkB family protein [Planctomycetes bacterium]|nr:YihY/virulence factor BrkB family protein [Planctomycetota bacterium]